LFFSDTAKNRAFFTDVSYQTKCSHFLGHLVTEITSIGGLGERHLYTVGRSRARHNLGYVVVLRDSKLWT